MDVLYLSKEILKDIDKLENIDKTKINSSIENIIIKEIKIRIKKLLRKKEDYEEEIKEIKLLRKNIALNYCQSNGGHIMAVVDKEPYDIEVTVQCQRCGFTYQDTTCIPGYKENKKMGWLPFPNILSFPKNESFDEEKLKKNCQNIAAYKNGPNYEELANYQSFYEKKIEIINEFLAFICKNLGHYMVRETNPFNLRNGEYLKCLVCGKTPVEPNDYLINKVKGLIKEETSFKRIRYK